MAKILLDKERELRLTLGAAKRFYQKTGRSLLKGEGLKELTEEDLSAFLWACLVPEEPQLTIEQLDDLIVLTPKKIEKITSIISSLVEEDKNPL